MHKHFHSPLSAEHRLVRQFLNPDIFGGLPEDKDTPKQLGGLLDSMTAKFLKQPDAKADKNVNPVKEAKVLGFDLAKMNPQIQGQAKNVMDIIHRGWQTIQILRDNLASALGTSTLESVSQYVSGILGTFLRSTAASGRALMKTLSDQLEGANIRVSGTNTDRIPQVLETGLRNLISARNRANTLLRQQNQPQREDMNPMSFLDLVHHGLEQARSFTSDSVQKVIADLLGREQLSTEKKQDKKEEKTGDKKADKVDDKKIEEKKDVKKTTEPGKTDEPVKKTPENPIEKPATEQKKDNPPENPIPDKNAKIIV